MQIVISLSEICIKRINKILIILRKDLVELEFLKLQRHPYALHLNAIIIMENEDKSLLRKLRV